MKTNLLKPLLWALLLLLNGHTAMAQNSATAWGDFLTNELNCKFDANTTQTIQQHFGALPHIVQDELKDFLRTHKALFYDLENTMYGLMELLKIITREELIDTNGKDVANEILENKNYKHNSENLDKIDEALKEWLKSIDKKYEVAIAIFEIQIEKEKNPERKATLTAELNEIKANVRAIAEGKREIEEGKREIEEGKREIEEGKKRLFEITLETYAEYKKDQDPQAWELILDAIPSLKKGKPTPEMKKFFEEIEAIQKQKSKTK